MKKDFYVGYLPFPDGLKPLFRTFVPVLLLAGLASVYLFSSGTPGTGNGSWDAYTEVTLTGRLELDPYPMITTPDRATHPVLVVQVGKLSADDALRPLGGQTVSLSGFMIERGPWQMLEIEGSGAALARAPLEVAPRQTSAEMFVSLKGEIVDSKCMLGVMKPGAGKVHRDCAELCIMGGMPPMLLVKNETGNKAAYLLVDENGGPVGRELVPHIAMPVQVSGLAYRDGDMPVIKVSAETVTTLAGDQLKAFGDSIGIAGTSSFCRIPS